MESHQKREETNLLFDLSATKVTNSRFFKRQNKVWRRRQTGSGVVFTTRESFDFDNIEVAKKNSRPQEDYQAGKLFLSIYKACDHLPDGPQTAWHIFQTIEEKLTNQLSESMILTVTDIALVSLTTLKNFDTTAYVKYGSYQSELVSARKLAATLN